MAKEGGLDFALNPQNIEKRAREEEITNLKMKLEEASKDGLTDLLRVEYLEPKLEKLISELKFYTENGSVEKRRSPLKSILVLRLDINRLKNFNEKPYNHEVGDVALRTFASQLKKVTKEGDILFRVGGDEFAIIMPIFEDSVDFAKLSNQIKERINKDLFIKIGEEELPVSSSLGYSVAIGKEKTARQLIAEADLMEREDKNKTQ